MSIAEQARKELREKLKLEKKLFNKVKTFNRKLVSSVLRNYLVTGNIFNAEALNDDLENLLFEHYMNVGKIFSGLLSNMIGEREEKVKKTKIGVTANEKIKIEDLITIYYRTRAKGQAKILGNTNAENVRNTFEDAMAALRAAGQVDQNSVGVLISSVLRKKLADRLGAIATTENQHAAEAAKEIEADVLLNEHGKDKQDVAERAKKEWVTVGDEAVRDAHVDADSQVVDISEPYNVGGELLKYPGDMSLGASIGNVINCRCSSVVDEQSFLAHRVTVVENELRTRVETEPGEQLLFSLGD